MRIKSYFAPSVQSAIGLARKEFGDDVTLVTSHASSLETRHLGEYEVVFAIEDPANLIVETAPADDGSAAPQPESKSVFRDLLQDAVSAPASTHANVPEKLEQIRTSFIELGIEPSMVRALMAMVERCLPLAAVTPASESKPATASAVLPDRVVLAGTFTVPEAIASPEPAATAEVPVVTLPVTPERAPEQPVIAVPVIRDSMAALDSIISEDVKLAFTAKPVAAVKPEPQIIPSPAMQLFAPPKSNLSAAEMAFVLSVSGGTS